MCGEALEAADAGSSGKACGNALLLLSVFLPRRELPRRKRRLLEGRCRRSTEHGKCSVQQPCTDQRDKYSIPVPAAFENMADERQQRKNHGGDKPPIRARSRRRLRAGAERAGGS